MGSITLTCPRCNRASYTNDNYCPGCGASFTPTHVAQPVPTVQPPTSVVVVNTQSPGFGMRVLAGIGGILVIILLLSFVGAFDAQRGHTDAVSEPAVPVAQLGQTVHVGYWTYRVNSAEWVPGIANGLTYEQPDAAFLVINLSARNEDRSESVLPPVKLIDASGREFSQSSAGALSDGFFSPLKSLNPGVGSRANVVFDVPPGQYRIRLSGGHLSRDSALVLLPARPQNAPDYTGQQ